MNKRFREILKSHLSLDSKINARHHCRVVTAKYRNCPIRLSRLPALDRNYRHYENQKVSIYLGVA